MSYNTYFSSGLSAVNSACGNDVCEYVVYLSSSICSSAAVINVTVSATNRLGEGPPTDPIVTGMDAYIILIAAELFQLIMALIFV